jgi:putative transposase
VTQQARNLTWTPNEAGVRPTVLLRDNDAKFPPAFDALVAGQAVLVIHTPVRAPQANAVAVRCVGTVRRECLDWLLITGEGHLRRVLGEVAEHDSTARPHRARGLQPPLGPPVQPPGGAGPVCRRDRLGGLLHEYQRVAA